MSARCCANETSSGCQTAIPPGYRRALWFALVVNGVMFAVEIGAGLRADSVSLLADSMDFLGDAANNQGTFHETMNMAALWNLPVIYACENNGYSEYTRTDEIAAGSITARAEAFGIEQWPITAVKAFVGHSLATASGDQVIAALGAFKYGIVPGLKTIDAVADDVHQKHLSLSTEDRKVGEQALDVAFINSKGFGGNNASALVLAPHVTERMLRKRHGQAAFDAYLARREGTRTAAAAYDNQALQGKLDIIYNFGNDMIDDQAISITRDEVKVPGFDQPLVFRKDERYSDMLD